MVGVRQVRETQVVEHRDGKEVRRGGVRRGEDKCMEKEMGGYWGVK